VARPHDGDAAAGDPPRRGWRLAALLAVGALLLVAVAVGSRSSPSGALRVPTTVGAWQAAFQAVLGILAGAIVAADVAILVLRALSRSGRREPKAPEWIVESIPASPLTALMLVLLPVLIVGGLIAWIVWTIIHLPKTVHHAAVLPLVPLRPGSPSGTAAAVTAGLPTPVWVGMLAGAALVAAAALVLVLRRPPVPGPALPAPPAETPVEVVDAAMGALATEGDPRRAVIAAYATMERLLAFAGSPRRATDTPAEHLARSLVLLGAGREPAGRLAALFERARFSHHPIDESVRQAALDALSGVRMGLEPRGAEP